VVRPHRQAQHLKTWVLQPVLPNGMALNAPNIVILIVRPKAGA